MAKKKNNTKKKQSKKAEAKKIEKIQEIEKTKDHVGQIYKGLTMIT